MASVVLGLGTSHTPQLSSPVEIWPDHVLRDQRNPALLGKDGEYHQYSELLALADPTIEPQLTQRVWESKDARAQRGLAELGATLAAVQPDILVVIGDDEEELFLEDCKPAFAIFRGKELTDLPPTAEKLDGMPAGLRAARWAAHADEPEVYPTVPELGQHLVESLIADEFDVAQFSRQHDRRSLGHAFTFPRRRLMGGRAVPLVPVFVNTYYPPNQPSPNRCFAFGRALRRAIDSWPDHRRVAVIASGGLSHFVVDEQLDRRVLDAMKNKDVESLTTIPRRHMRSGTSETLNWITLAGVVEDLEMDLVDYIPGYRSPAGTGVGIAFARWS
jgi:3-O-methylgallate 3,4-dioxygenase